MSDQAKTIQEVTEAVKAIQQKAEKFGMDSAEAKATSAKVEAALVDFDAKNQQLVKDLAAAKEIAAEQKGRIETIESMLARSSQNGKKAYKESAEYKAIQQFIKTGETKSLRMEDAVEGGYLVPHEMAQEIIKNITEISDIRAVSKVRTVNKQVLNVPKRTGIPTAAWEGELEQAPQGQSTYGNETLSTHRLAVEVPVTMDLLGDAAFDMEAEIASDVAEAFRYAEGYAFVKGNGVKKPEGFAAKASLQAAAATLSSSGFDAGAAAKILEMTGTLKVGYNPLFAFNRATLARLRALKGTSNDHFIWQNNLAEGAPATLGGMPYVIAQDMDDVGSNTYPIVYADFKQGYMITDRTGMYVIRDNVTQARKALILLNFLKWTHGQVVKDEAFKLLKTT